jgi:small nuclear ribonucleoprotein
LTFKLKGVRKLTDRPIDALDRAKGKKVMVKLKNGEEVTGILKALDLHLNVWLEEAEISKSDTKLRVGTLLVRGDTIVYASPV